MSRTSRGLGRRVAVRFSLLVALGAIAFASCSSPARTYRPRTDLVAQTGLVEVAQALQQALEDVQAPVITAVRFGAEHLEFTCQPSNVRDARFSSQHRVIRTFRCRHTDMRLDLRALVRIDIVQPSSLLVLRDGADAVLAMLMPHSPDHALRLIDLLASLRAAVDDAQSEPFPPLAVTYARETQQSTSGGGAL